MRLLPDLGGVLFAVAGAGALVTSGRVFTTEGADPPSGEAAARQVALDFIKSYKARDKDRMLQLSSVPWLYDFTVTLKTRQQLDDHLRVTAAAKRQSENFTDA